LTIESLPAGRNNNFNLLRLLAAAAVIVSHSYPLSLGKGTPEPLQIWTGSTLGGAAVEAFFAVSGFFIAQSFDRCRSLVDFLAARLLRLIPALAIVSVLLAGLVGPLVSALDAGAYYSSPKVWWYAPRAISIFWRGDTLPGVFLSNPYPNIVNGPLWTLTYEVLCYTALVSVALCGLINRRLFPIFAGLFLTFYLVAHFLIRYLDLTVYANMGLPFFIGVAVYVYRDIIPLRGLIFTLMFAAAVGFTVIHFAVTPAWAVVIAYGCFCFGFAWMPLLLRYNRFGDYSYGLYIYGWPVQQLAAQFIPGIQPVGLMCITFGIAIPCAILSWTFVERPALRLRASLTEARLPAPLTFMRRPRTASSDSGS
jgi:peptidoglycan/LPS O-acetylase OafA/YrhL